jgi:hypothetical protein
MFPVSNYRDLLEFEKIVREIMGCDSSFCSLFQCVEYIQMKNLIKMNISSCSSQQEKKDMDVYDIQWDNPMFVLPIPRTSLIMYLLNDHRTLCIKYSTVPLCENETDLTMKMDGNMDVMDDQPSKNQTSKTKELRKCTGKRKHAKYALEEGEGEEEVEKRNYQDSTLSEESSNLKPNDALGPLSSNKIAHFDDFERHLLNLKSKR